MPETYRAVMLPKKGGPEVLQVVELPVEPPAAGQIRIRVGAAGVGATDLTVLAGKYLFAPKIPLVPGYEVAGVGGCRRGWSHQSSGGTAGCGAHGVRCFRGTAYPARRSTSFPFPMASPIAMRLP
ncbi:MAG: alcohol dehydrogenase catalytic domain-containing protein [Ignavibacteriota bacterium]